MSPRSPLISPPAANKTDSITTEAKIEATFRGWDALSFGGTKSLISPTGATTGNSRPNTGTEL